MLNVKNAVLLITISIILHLSLAGRAPTWDECNCYWGTWKSWAQCSETCGGGSQVRTRSVWHDDIPKCDSFEKCATGDLGRQRRVCNTNCYNGGSYVPFSTYFGFCRCPKGKKGSCCEQTVTCGKPNTISHGRFTASVFTYNSQVTYHCDTGYNMTTTSISVRRCTENGYWSGSSPICLYATSCNSNPCKNGATCVNLLGDFECMCQQGWSGKMCDFDIQPPVVEGCPHNRTIYTSSMTSFQEWEVPTITDPHHTEVKVTKNYPTNSYEFPWGEFVIQYFAVKPANGLKSDCLFSITVKPNPCKELDAPENGIVMCNNWRTEYTRVCTYSCLSGYILPPGYTGTMLNCGASGNWLPSPPLGKCFSPLLQEETNEESKEDSNVFETCDEAADQAGIEKAYINALQKSEFNSLCLENIDECIPANVDIKCDK